MQEERRCWMEAIKPGSTHNQWADPFPLSSSRRQGQVFDHLRTSTLAFNEETQQPTSSESEVQSESALTVTSGPEQMPFPEDSNLKESIRMPTPPPRSGVSLWSESYDPYVPANELMPPRDSSRVDETIPDHLAANKSETTEEPDTQSIYLKLLPLDEPSDVSEHHDQSSTHHNYGAGADTERASEVVAELEEQFSPLEIDLLVKMLEKISAKTKKTGSKQKERRRSTSDTVHKEAPDDDQLSISSQDVEEDSSATCSRLADLVQDLDSLESTNVLSEESILYSQEDDSTFNGAETEMSPPTRQHLSSSSKSAMSSDSSETGRAVYGHRVLSRAGPHHGSVKEDSLFCRKNAVRQRKVETPKPKETVTHLSKSQSNSICMLAVAGYICTHVDPILYEYFSGKLLRRASSEDFLEDDDDESVAHPIWSRANGIIISQIVL